MTTLHARVESDVRAKRGLARPGLESVLTSRVLEFMSHPWLQSPINTGLEYVSNSPELLRAHLINNNAGQAAACMEGGQRVYQSAAAHQLLGRNIKQLCRGRGLT